MTKKELFLDTVGHGNNVDGKYLEPYHIETLGNHSLKVIDFIVKTFPNIKLLFWCLYKRSKVNKSSYPEYLWYDSIKERYKNNIIDIDKYLTPIEFSKKIVDEGGHPNKEGLILMSDMIKAEFS